MKHLILATLLVAPVALADHHLPVRQLDNQVRVTPSAFYLTDNQGGEWTVKTDCQVGQVTRFDIRSRVIREGTKVRVTDNDYCEVISVVPTEGL